MKTVNIHQAKTTLSALLSEIEENGSWVQICRNGRPVAELRPIQAKRRSLRQNPKLKVRFKGDPSQPLDAEDWQGWV